MCWWKHGGIKTLLHCWWECKNVSHYGKQFDSSSKSKYNIMTQKLQFWVYIQKNWRKVLSIAKYTYIHTHTHTHIYTVSTIAKTEKQSKFPSMYGWINKFLCIHVIEYYAVINRNEVQRYTSTWKNSEILRPSEKSKTQNITYCVILFIRNIQNKCIHRSWT